MPWRLIQFIILFAIFLVFIICNLGNKCNIHFIFFQREDVPVFLTVFVSFMIGILCTIPFIFSSKSRKKIKNIPEKGLLGKAPDTQDAHDRPMDNLTDTRIYGID
ncbi:MAG: hypothetical protein FWD36_01945 [Treponema sp.]|nr:hypothetical protein [Treponema sp.]